MFFCSARFQFLQRISMIRISICFLICCLEMMSNSPASAQAVNENGAAKKPGVREFTFEYAATVKQLPKGTKVKVWVPIASSNPYQQVEMQQVKSITSMSIHEDSEYGNSIGYFETVANDAGELPLRLVYRVRREEVQFLNRSEDAKKLPDISDRQKKRFLAADKLVPTAGKPLELLEGVELPDESLEAGRTLYGLVEDHMKYDKSKPGWGNGDSAWACDSRTGNCTDFHSLFISLARSRKLPARFEIGFPLPTDSHAGAIKGYHCWAWMFIDGKGWLPVDISEADKHPEMRDYYFGNLTPDRVAFSSGRDIKLTPQAAADRLNFFVYPHVEVEDQTWDRDKIELDFSFSDLSQ